MTYVLDEQENLEDLVATQLLHHLMRQPSHDPITSVSINDSLNDDLGLTSRELF